MHHHRRTVVLGLILALLALAGCGAEEDESEEEPARVEVAAGSDSPRIVLTESAADRLDIQTAPVREVEVCPEDDDEDEQADLEEDEEDEGCRAAGKVRRNAVPYSAVLYQADGSTWAYTNPEPLVFVRQHISVEDVEEGIALLTEGPPVGTAVVTVGVQELFGTESGLGGGGH